MRTLDGTDAADRFPAGERESRLPEPSATGASTGTSALPSCLVCGRTRPRKIYRTPHQELLRCENCTLVFGWPVFSRESLLDDASVSFRGEGFPETANYFDRGRVGRSGSALQRKYRRGLEQISLLVPSGRLLDVGCGVPIFLDLARSAGYDVEGIDPVPEVARMAREDFGLPVRTAPFDRCRLEEASFDVITMWDSLEHLPDPLAALDRSHQLLRPGGVLFVSVPNYRSALHAVAALLAKLPHPSIRERLDKIYHFSHVCIWTPRAIEAALGRARFSPLSRGFDSPDLTRYRLGATVRAGLTLIDFVGRLTGLRSRLWILASRVDSLA
jgi:SAM-dependent methyltransferase